MIFGAIEIINTKIHYMKKNNNLSEEKEFEKHLQKLEDPTYERETNFALSEKPTTLEKTKFGICQAILRYKRENNLNREQMAQQIQLSKAETEEILFCRIDNFTLDRLTEYADRLFSSLEIKITKAESKRANI